MQLSDTDYQCLRELASSRGWAILLEEVNRRIESIEAILHEPELSDAVGKNMTPEQELNLIKYKKMERKYLVLLKALPESLINTKILPKSKE